MEQNEQKKEKALLVGLRTGVFSSDENSDEDTLEELSALLKTAGGVCVGSMLQTRQAPDPKFFVGEGKAEEIRQMAEANAADILIFDNELSPSQMKNLEMLTGCSVLDRSGLILDIFAQRAATNEGKLQVELAQYQYILPRLAGLGRSMSRLGGGIGTRGPGESKLESDRRHIRRRIDKLTRDLEDVKRTRAVQRRRRIRAELPLVCIVGYTNAGKSTLLNALTGAGIPANDRLFDTLDPTTRRFRLSDTQEVLLSDTVGFLRRLPHHLIDAFRATLEELSYADLLLHVVDASAEDYAVRQQTVEQVLRELGADDIPCLTIYNKADACRKLDGFSGKDSILISAKRRRGMETLLQKMERELMRGQRRMTVSIPFEQGAVLDAVHNAARVENTSYTEQGVLLTIVCDEKLAGKLAAYQTDGEAE